MYSLNDGEIVPGKRIGPFEVGMTRDEVLSYVTEYELEDREITTVMICDDVKIWIDNDSNTVSQILVYGSFRGKYRDVIGIGSTLKDAQDLLHATWHEDLDTRVLDDAPGMCFELGDSGDDTYWDELTAPIEMISVYSAEEGANTYSLNDGEIVPGKRIGPFELGMTWDEVQSYTTKYVIEVCSDTYILTCNNVKIWIDEGSDTVSRILVFGSFGGKYRDVIGIGSTLQDAQDLLHATWHKDSDTYVLDDAPGMRFELGDLGDDTDRDELTAPIEMISVYPAEGF